MRLTGNPGQHTATGTELEGSVSGRLTLPAVGTADLREAPVKLLQASAEAMMLGAAEGL